MDDDAGALPPKQDFSGWFNDLLWRAGIMDVRYPVKGLYVWYPYGFAIRKFVYQRLPRPAGPGPAGDPFPAAHP